MGTLTCFRFLVAYNGERFSGFQEQESVRTVEGEFKKALAAIVGVTPKITVAGRTDAGVHARGQVVSAELLTRLQPRQLMLALQTKLPNDMAVWRIDKMPLGFDARRQSVGKRYVYRIFQGLVADPFLRATSLHVREKLDLNAMQEAAKLFVGEHDFQSFRSSLCTAAHARRYLWHVQIEKKPSLIEIDIRGNAFCLNMVRIIVGTLIEIGKGRRTKDSIAQALAIGDRTRAGITAKACGLTLDEVYYPDALAHADIPPNAVFPRFPVTASVWKFANDAIEYGPT